MREQRKVERVKILGAEVDPVRVDRALNLTSRYLEWNKFEYIVFINTASAIRGQESEEFAQFLSQAVLALPGDKNIENAIEKDLRIEEDENYQLEYFKRLFNKLNRMGASVYVMQEREENLGKIQEDLCRNFSHLTVEEVLWQDDENLDPLVNQINIVTPDILLICGSYEKIWAFMKEYKSKINADLCFCMEELVQGETKEVPAWMEHLHLAGIYRWIVYQYRHLFYDRAFKRKMKEIDLEQQESKSPEKRGEEDEKEDF